MKKLHLVWKYIMITPVMITRFLFCFMLMIFDLEIASFVTAWKETR